MKATITLLILLALTVPLFRAQTQPLATRRATVTQLETQPATLNRDTLLVMAYADLVRDLIKKEPPDSCLLYIEKAGVLARKRDWQQGILLTLIRKASCLNIANRHYEALRVGLTGLTLAEKQGDLYYQGLFHRSLGNNYDMLDNYDKAIPHYETCLRLSERIPALLITRAHALVELGDAYRFIRKQPGRAKKLIEQAIAIYQANDSSSLGYAYDYYGQALTDLHLFQEAEESFIRAHRYNTQSEKEYLLSELLLHEAELYVLEKKYEKAIAKAQDCLIYSKRKKSLYGQRGAYRVLFASYKAQGRMSEALASHEQFVFFNDALNETSNSERFQAVRAGYEQQTQTDRISQLTISQQRRIQQILVAGLSVLLIFLGYVFYNNRQLRRKNRAISGALLQGQTLERQRVAADLHDNLGGTLSALHWSLEAIDKTRLTPVEQAVYATISQQVSQAYTDVRLLSHNLLPDELAKQGLVVALAKLVDKMNLNTTVRFCLTGTDNFPRLDRQLEFELYSVCLELLTNITKHARATEGYIDIAQHKGRLKLTVGDNGAGLTTGQRSDGRGLQNVAARVASLGGTWVVVSVPDGGIQHQIAVPIRTPAHASSQT